MTKLRSVTVRGRQHEWSLDIYADDATVAELREDGLEVITPVYTIPAWIAHSGLGRLWAAWQDAWNLRWPLK